MVKSGCNFGQVILRWRLSLVESCLDRGNRYGKRGRGKHLNAHSSLQKIILFPPCHLPSFRFGALSNLVKSFQVIWKPFSHNESPSQPRKHSFNDKRNQK